jgi:hypothetical protein
LPGRLVVARVPLVPAAVDTPVVNVEVPSPISVRVSVSTAFESIVSLKLVANWACNASAHCCAVFPADTSMTQYVITASRLTESCLIA